mgnify:CR=1 FL=1
MLSPCKNCPCRFVGCHIQCPQYKAYTEDNTAIRERDTQRRHLEYELTLQATKDEKGGQENEQTAEK